MGVSKKNINSQNQYVYIYIYIFSGGSFSHTKVDNSKTVAKIFSIKKL